MQINQKIEPNSQNGDNVVSQLWSRFFPYWPLFLFFIIVAVLGARFYLKYKIPVYETTTTILIKDEKKGEDDSRIIESLNLLSTKKIMENEIEVLKSKGFMMQVVKKLHLYAPVFEKGKPVDFSAYASSPVTIEIA